MCKLMSMCLLQVIKKNGIGLCVNCVGIVKEEKCIDVLRP